MYFKIVQPLPCKNGEEASSFSGKCSFVYLCIGQLSSLSEYAYLYTYV